MNVSFFKSLIAKFTPCRKSAKTSQRARGGTFNLQLDSQLEEGQQRDLKIDANNRMIRWDNPKVSKLANWVWKNAWFIEAPGSVQRSSCKFTEQKSFWPFSWMFIPRQKLWINSLVADFFTQFWVKVPMFLSFLWLTKVGPWSPGAYLSTIPEHNQRMRDQLL